MKKWFSKSKSADKLMSEMLDSTSKGLESRIAVLEDEIKQIESELEAIKSKFSHSPGNTLKTNLKNKAIHLLKRKKVLEQHRDFALNQSLSIMQADISLDTVKGSIDTYKTMKGANKKLSKQLKKVNMDKLEDLANSVRGCSGEIDQALESFDNDSFDEEELFNELNDISHQKADQSCNYQAKSNTKTPINSDQFLQL